MSRARVFYRETSGANLPEWVKLDSSKKIITCTRDALSKLWDWCSNTARAIGFTLIVAGSANTVLAAGEKSDSNMNTVAIATSDTSIPQINVIQGNQSNKLWDLGWKSPVLTKIDPPNTVRVNIQDVLQMLSGSQAARTVEAIEFLKSLEATERVALLSGSAEFNPILRKIYVELNDPTNLTPAPTLEEFQSFLLEEKWKKLATSISTVLWRDIKPEELVNLNKAEQDKLEGENVDLFDEFELYRIDYRKLQLALSEKALNEARQKATVAEQKATVAEQKATVAEQKATVAQTSLVASQEKLKNVEARLVWWKKISDMLAQANIQQ